MVAGSSYARSHRAGAVLGLFLFLIGISAGNREARRSRPELRNGGRVFIEPSRSFYFGGANAIASQRDGRLLLSGDGGHGELAVVRLADDGRPDPTFGDQGLAFVTSTKRGSAQAVLELRNGMIVAAGYLRGDFTEASIVRYEIDGRVDTNFSASGVVSERLGARHASLSAIAEGDHGELIAAGVAYDSTVNVRDIIVARFSANGSLDGTFGDGGVLRVDLSGSGLSDETAHALTLQPDGKVLVAGYTVDQAGEFRFLIVRALRDEYPGSHVWNRRTISAIEVPGARRSWVSLHLQADGKLVLAGQVQDASGKDCSGVLVRVNPDGRADLTYGSDGLALWPLGPCAAYGGGSSVMEPGGAIIAGQTAADGYGRVTRLTSEGAVDRTFGVEGSTLIDMGIETSIPNYPNVLPYRPFVNDSVGIKAVRREDGRIALVAIESLGWGRRCLLRPRRSLSSVAQSLARGTSPGLVGFDAGTTVNESEAIAHLVVRRTGGTAGAVSVDFRAQNNNTTAGADYQEVSGTLTWPDGDSGCKEDPTFPSSMTRWSTPYESISVALVNPTGGVALASTRANVYIVDDDIAPPATSTPSTNPALGPASGFGAGRGGGGVDCVAYCSP